MYDKYIPIYNYDVSTSDENSYMIDSFIVNFKYDCFRKCSSRTDCLMVSYKSNNICKHFKMVKYSQPVANSLFLYEKNIPNYNSSLGDSLTYYWPFNNGVTDIVSGITLSGGSSSATKSFTPDRMNRQNSALYLNNGYYNFPDGVYLYGDCSLTVWVKVRTIKDWTTIFVVGRSGGLDTVNAIWMGISYSSTGKPFLRACDTYLISPIVLDTEKWFHLAFTYVGIKTSIYINGALVAQNPNDCAAANIDRQYNSIGAKNSAGAISYIGDVEFDDLKLFKKTLSAVEILNDVNSYY